MKSKLLLSLFLGAAICANAEGYKDGIEYFKADQFTNAKEILQRNLNNPGTDKAISYYYLGAIELRNGDKTAAKAEFDKGVSANPECAYNYIGLGELDLLNGNTSNAEANFKKALGLDKKNYELLVLVARAYYNADAVKYAKDIDKYLAKARKDSKLKEPSIYILEGDMLMDKNQPGDAAASYENAIYFEDGNSEGYVKYANAYFHVNPDFAVQKLEELLQKQPNSALAQRELAEKYYENNQWRKASDQYGRYIQNPNHFPEDKARYSVLLYYGENYDQSLQVANELLAVSPEDFLMNRMRMLDLASLERNAEAKEAGEKFFSLNGYFTGNDYITYSNVLNKLGESDAGVAIIERGAEALSDNAAMQQTLSQTYAGAKRYPEAAAAFDRYIQAKGDEVVVTDYFTGAGRYLTVAATTDSLPIAEEAANKGLVYVEKALELQPANPSLWRRKAQLIQMGNGKNMNAEAAQAFEKLVELLDQNPDGKNPQSANNDIDYYKNAYTMLGLYYDSISDKDTAVKYFELLLEIDPENEGVRQYVEKAKES